MKVIAELRVDLNQATTRELLSQVPPPEPFDHRAPSGTGHFDHGAMV
jgi:hypothetical protein